MQQLIIFFTFVCLCHPVKAQPESGPTEPAYLYKATVVRFVVGDTIDVDNDTGFYIWIKQQHFRLIDIDASGMRDVERPPGLDSVEYLTDLIGGKKIIIQTIKGRDGGDSRGKYGRWLGRIYLNGMDVNQHMIDVGYEIEYAN